MLAPSWLPTARRWRSPLTMNCGIRRRGHSKDFIVQRVFQHPWSLCRLHDRGRRLEFAPKGCDDGRWDAELLQENVLKLRHKGDTGDEIITTHGPMQQDLSGHFPVEEGGD